MTVNGALSCVTVAIGFAGALIDGARLLTPHVCGEDAALRGTRPLPVVATKKSSRLLSVSWQPSDLRTAPLEELRPMPLFTVVPPSPLFAAPHDTESTMRLSGSAHGVAVAPQPRAEPLLTSATLPLPAAMLRPVEVRSPVIGAPSEPAAPSLISR